jgi:glutamate synthase (NADPH/NADH) large chain
VVEGVGEHACEYMTGGVVVVLGQTGRNFAAGMTGGMAFVLDLDGRFTDRVNPETVVWQRIDTPHWEAVVKGLVEQHFRETQSRYVERLLADWEIVLPKFWQIVPKEMLSRLAYPLKRADAVLASAGDE